jgi:hypothetical protein
MIPLITKYKKNLKNKDTLNNLINGSTKRSSNDSTKRSSKFFEF